MKIESLLDLVEDPVSGLYEKELNILKNGLFLSYSGDKEEFCKTLTRYIDTFIGTQSLRKQITACVSSTQILLHKNDKIKIRYYNKLCFLEKETDYFIVKNLSEIIKKVLEMDISSDGHISISFIPSEERLFAETRSKITGEVSLKDVFESQLSDLKDYLKESFHSPTKKRTSEIIQELREKNNLHYVYVARMKSYLSNDHSDFGKDFIKQIFVEAENQLKLRNEFLDVFLEAQGIFKDAQISTIA